MVSRYGVPIFIGTKITLNNMLWLILKLGQLIMPDNVSKKSLLNGEQCRP